MATPETDSLPAAPRIAFVRELGRGGVARVELARLLEPFAGRGRDSLVAVKRPLAERADDPRALESLVAELHVGEKVRDDGLVEVLGLYRDADGPLLLLDYLPGSTLREVLAERGPLPEPLVRHVGRQLAGALRALHRAGFVHGDVKPENVRLDDRGQATLIDLGFARRIEETSGLTLGSLPYLSPERVRGGGPSTSSDVFALGVVLYELCTGRHPFVRTGAADSGSTQEAGGGVGSLEETFARDLVPPSRYAPRTSPLLDALLGALLASRPAARPSAEGAYRVLHEGESGPWWRRRLHEGESSGELWISVRGQRFPLVGRERELAALARASVDTQPDARHGRVVCVRGPAGSGKTRLVEAFLARVRQARTPPLVLATRVSDHGESRPFGSTLKLLRRYLQLPEDAAPSERDERALSQLVPPHDAEVLLRALDVRSSEEIQGSVSLSLARVLGALARRRALIVFMDDVQRAREGTLLGLERIATELERGPGLLVLGLDSEGDPARPEALEPLLERMRSAVPSILEELTLRPVDVDSVRQLVAHAFHHTVPRLRLARVLWERSRGHVGLLTEILETLQERGQVRPVSEEDARWLLLTEPEQLPLPESFQASLGERYRRLAPNLRHWLERVAVVGGRIEPEFLRRTFAPTTRAEIDEVLAELVARGWLEPVGARYRFARPALRDAVYRALSNERRARLHERAARSLASEGDPEQAPVAAYQRAFHLRSSGAYGDLLEELEPLLVVTGRRGSPRRVLRLADWGLEALAALPAAERPPGLELRLLERAADGADLAGDRRAMRRLLDRLARCELDPERDPLAAGRAFVLHARYADLQSQVELAEQLLHEARRLGERGGDPGLESEATRRLARLYSQDGRFDEARTQLEHALARATGPTQTAAVLFVRALVDVLEDRLEDALADCRRGFAALRAEEASPNRLGLQAGAWLIRARALRSLGRARRALAAAARALELCRRSGERRFEAEAQARYGGLLLELGRIEEAEAALREARLVARETEDGRGACLAALGLGLLLSERGDADARGALQQGLTHARRARFARGEAFSLALLARIDRAQGDVDTAAQRSEEALAISDRVGAELFDRLTIAGTRAMVLEAQDRSGEARSLVRELEREVLTANQDIRSPGLRASHRTYARELLALVREPAGPLTPRRAGPA